MINKKSIENRQLAQDGLKRCPKCQEIKSIVEFSKKTSTWDGSRSSCKDCDKLAHDEYRSNPENKQREAEYDYNYHRDNLQAISDYNKKYRQENPDIVKSARRNWHLAHKESENAISKERMKQWVKDNPDRHRQNNRKRRANEYQAEGSHTLDQWRMLQCFYNDHCPRCGKEAKLSLDHIVPLIRGGTHYIDNIQGLCKPCNTAKRDRVIVDYRPKEARYWAWVEMSFVAIY